MNRLKEKYIKEVTPSLVEKFNYSSVMQTPKVDKIVINMGVMQYQMLKLRQSC